MAVEHSDPGWDYLGKGEHAAYALSFTLEIYTWSSCNTLSSSRSFWFLLSCYSCLVSCLKFLYKKGLFYYRDFKHRLTIRSNLPQLLCLDLHNATLRQTRLPDDLLLEATTPTFFPCLALNHSQLTRPTISSVIPRLTPRCLQIGVSYGATLDRPGKFSVSAVCHSATSAHGQLLRSMLCGLLDIGALDRNFSLPSRSACSSLCSSCCIPLRDTFKLGVTSSPNSAGAVIPRSSCCAPSGAANRNLNNFMGSAVGLITLCLCFTPTNATHVAEEAKKPSVVYLIPKFTGGSLHLSRRGASTHDARWRAMVIGSTIGSTAGAVILGIGIYLLFRARRRRRAADPSRSESQPIEMQPTRSARVRSPNPTQTPRSRPPPRAQAHDASVGASSWVAKTPRTPSLASLELQPKLLHPRDISRAAHIRASTGSQFTEHFEPVLGAHSRPSGGPSTGEAGRSPGMAVPTLGADPQGSGGHAEPPTPGTSEQPHEQFERPRSDSQMTARLPPGAAAPVESIANYVPPGASNTQNSRIRLS